MKQIFTLLVPVTIGILLTATVWAQSPGKMSYQAVIRNGSDELVTNQAIGMQISILQSSASGTVVYVETQTPTTNASGLVSLEIGTGFTTYDFSSIDWSAGPYFIKTETDPTGGASYTIKGTSQLLSVPYALYAANAKSYAAGSGIDITNNIISTTGGATELAIGKSYGGGIIFWLDASGQHGLIADTADQSPGIQWYNGTYFNTGATGDGLYAGKMNTAIIIATQMADNESGNFAAKVCADYEVTVDDVTYGDWYLPSIYELNLLLNQKDAVGGFESALYWSSNELQDNLAFGLFGEAYLQFDVDKKIDIGRVRAVRAF